MRKTHGELTDVKAYGQTALSVPTRVTRYLVRAMQAFRARTASTAADTRDPVLGHAPHYSACGRVALVWLGNSAWMWSGPRRAGGNKKPPTCVGGW